MGRWMDRWLAGWLAVWTNRQIDSTIPYYILSDHADMIRKWHFIISYNNHCCCFRAMIVDMERLILSLTTRISHILSYPHVYISVILLPWLQIHLYGLSVSVTDSTARVGTEALNANDIVVAYTKWLLFCREHFHWISLNRNLLYFDEMSLKFVLDGPINKRPPLV